MKRARLVVNPGAGTDRAVPLLPRINAGLRALVEELDVTITTGAEDIEHASSRALEEGCDALFVAGGDGTLNHALRGLLAPGTSAVPMLIGVVPTGTGNDFAKALDLGETAESAMAAFADRRVVDVDIGTINDLPFVNASAGGFVADVSEAVTEGLKDVAGKLAYIIGGARALLGSEPFSSRIAMPDGNRGIPSGFSESRALRMFAVCNARFIGGGYPIAPDAAIDDGLVDVLVVPDMPTVDFVRALQGIAGGSGSAHPDVLHFRAASFDFEFDRAVRVNTDGEVLETNAARYRVHPRAARFLCGPAPHAKAVPAPLVDPTRG